MRVTCEFHATVREAVGEKRIEREIPAGTTVRALLDQLNADHDGLGPLLFDGEGRLRPNINVLVADDPVRNADGTELSDGDTLILAPSVAGGR
jgi:molybdopterin synthase sulfur carrier subunit